MARESDAPPNAVPLVGYSDRMSLRPGERVRFRVGATAHEVDYVADIVRLRCADIQAGGAGLREFEVESPIAGSYRATRQRVDRGSRAVVPATSLVASVESFSLQIRLWPTRPGRTRQALMGTWDAADRRGFALFIDESGKPAMIWRDGRGEVRELHAKEALRTRQWATISASFDAHTGWARLIAESHVESAANGLAAKTQRVETETTVATSPIQPPVTMRPIVFAAWRDGADERGTRYNAHFDGKLEAPRILRGVVDELDSSTFASTSGQDLTDPDVIGWWDFAREQDSRKVLDLSENALHGELENLPTRAVTGHLWNAREHDWRHAPEQYAAIHFHSDDLYDAGWPDAFALDVPSDWPSGIYAARLRCADAVDYVPFFVAPPKGQPRAKLAFLIPTATYLAYANMPDPHMIVRALGESADGGDDGGGGGEGDISERLQKLMAGEEFGPSCYHAHADESGVHHSSHLRPVRNLKPRTDLWAFNADTLICDWLEASGFDYDIVTDDLLDEEGSALLSPYQAVVTGSHPEYMSTAMREGIDAYLGGGGRLINLGANGFYWRIAYSDAWPGAIELRRAEDGTRAWESPPGEYHHAWGGELGGLWRRIGRTPNSLVGVGFTAQGFGPARPYQVMAGASNPRAAFVFEGVKRSAGEVFGDFGRLGGAAGEEIDRFDPRLGSPLHAIVLASASGFGPGMVKTKEEFLAMTPPDPSDPDVRADLVFFETPQGGAVFSTGSIAWSGSLAHEDYENDISRITANVVRRFLDPARFETPEIRAPEMS